LDLRSELIKMSQSTTARVLAGTVALVVFTILWVVFVSNLHNDFSILKSQRLAAEQSSISKQLNAVDGDYELLRESLVNESVVGLILTSATDELVFKTGNTTNFAKGGSKSIKDFFIAHSQWNIETDQGTVIVTAFVDTQPDVAGLVAKALQLFVFTVFTSLVVAAVAMLGTFRLYILPMERLIRSLRDSRESKLDSLPKLIDVPERNHLTPLAVEINNLIEGQRDSAKLLKVKQQYLEYTAHHDPLSHLPNRLQFENVLKTTVRTATDEDGHFAIFLVDLDNFKFFNDQYGHLVGDNMVVEVSNRLQSQISEADIVARLDGDEFVVLHRGLVEQSDAKAVAKKIMDVVSESYEHRGFTLKVSVSVGVSRFPLDVSDSENEDLLAEELINNATVALQSAKENGKGRYQLFNERMRSEINARIHIEQDLKIALQEEQFEVFYQPKINIKTKQCSGSEALVRWNHPEKGFVSPEIFVPVAEETGMIIELGAHGSWRS